MAFAAGSEVVSMSSSVNCRRPDKGIYCIIVDNYQHLHNSAMGYHIVILSFIAERYVSNQHAEFFKLPNSYRLVSIQIISYMQQKLMVCLNDSQPPHWDQHLLFVQ
jgi:hypothetical protein